MYSLYKIVNHTKGKLYVGISKRPDFRFALLVYGRHHNGELNKDFLAGDNIKLEIIKSNIPKVFRFEIEAEEISYYAEGVLYNKTNPLKQTLVITYQINKDLHFEFKKAALAKHESMTDAVVKFIKSYIKKTTKKQTV